ncbi:MAG: hypothetical protein ACFFD1_02795 [Candidatus Thorarchaeota archaeon]
MAICQIVSCSNESTRTVGKDRLSDALKKENLELNARTKETKVKLCKEHYKRLKKHMKKKDKIERLRWKI